MQSYRALFFFFGYILSSSCSQELTFPAVFRQSVLLFSICGIFMNIKHQIFQIRSYRGDDRHVLSSFQWRCSSKLDPSCMHNNPEISFSFPSA